MFFGAGYVQRAMFAFIVLTLLSCVFEGVWLSDTDYGVMRTLTYFTSMGSGFWVFPLAVVGFLASLPQMLIWDYSFFHSLGSFGAIMRLILAVTISIGFVWGFATMLWPIIANFFVSVVKGLGGLLSRWI